MTTLLASRDVAAPADKVWSVLIDLDGSPSTISAISSIERLDGGDGFGVGTKWRETRTMFGREATEEMEGTSVDPGRSYTVEADGPVGVRYITTMSVEPTGEGSRVSMKFEAEPTTLLARVGALVGKRFE